MYTILLVDDEKSEREGLKKLILRSDYPLHVLQAKNGEDALEVFSSYPIDILLTDIKMPFMNGIELIEAVHKRGFFPICIIYSAYGEFEYAKNAIELGVLQYLLKPINLDDFHSLFQRTIALCNERKAEQIEKLQIIEEKRQRESEILYKGLLMYLEGIDVGETELRRMEDTFGNRSYFPFMISGYSSIFSLKWRQYIESLRPFLVEETVCLNKDESQFLFLMPIHKILSDMKIEELAQNIIRISEKEFHSEIVIVFGDLCHGLDDLMKTYKKMTEVLDYQFFLTESTYLTCDSAHNLKIDDDLLTVQFDKVLTHAKLEDYENIKSEFGKIFTNIEKSIGFSSLYIKYNFTEIMKNIYEIFHMDEKTLDIIKGIYDTNSLEEIRVQINRFMEEVYEAKKDEVKNEHRLIGIIKNIVHKNYQDSSLSISSIADELNVSAAYLSTLFKTETGQNLVKYISSYRLERAKYLLTATNMKIAEISLAVGYQNASYFISLFHNHVGLSPVQFRENERC